MGTILFQLSVPCLPTFVVHFLFEAVWPDLKAQFGIQKMWKACKYHQFESLHKSCLSKFSYLLHDTDAAVTARK